MSEHTIRNTPEIKNIIKNNSSHTCSAMTARLGPLHFSSVAGGFPPRKYSVCLRTNLHTDRLIWNWPVMQFIIANTCICWCCLPASYLMLLHCEHLAIHNHDVHKVRNEDHILRNNRTTRTCACRDLMFSNIYIICLCDRMSWLSTISDPVASFCCHNFTLNHTIALVRPSNLATCVSLFAM